MSASVSGNPALLLSYSLSLPPPPPPPLPVLYPSIFLLILQCRRFRVYHRPTPFIALAFNQPLLFPPLENILDKTSRGYVTHCHSNNSIFGRKSNKSTYFFSYKYYLKYYQNCFMSVEKYIIDQTQFYLILISIVKLHNAK